MKRILYLIFLIALATFIFLARRTKYHDFHDAEINGSIASIYRYRSYVMMTINENEFRTIPVPLKNAPQLDDVAKVGDQLVKQAGNDTLTLTHEANQRFYYIVQKY